MHDQIGADRRGASCRLRPHAPAAALDLAEPGVELSGTAAIDRGKRADHAGAASRDDELDAGDEKHRRRNQRQAEAVAKALKDIRGSPIIS